MSSGPFTSSKYIANNGDVYPIKIQPETLALTIGGAANTAPAAAVDQLIRARVSGSRRGYGVFARTVTVQLTAALTGYKADALITLPVLQASIWESYGYDATGTYQGTACKVVGKRAEKKK